jgi:hypothetical protein
VNTIDAFSVGIAPEHVPALLAACLLPVLVYIVRRLRPVALPVRRSTMVELWAAWLLGISGAVHLALPLGHFDGPVLAIGFIGSGALYAWLAMRALEGRSWRLMSALLIVATLIAYMVVTGKGGEEPDQVGIATALAELGALGLCFVPARTGRSRWFARSAGATGTLAITLIVGIGVWVSSFLAHTAGGSTSDTTAVGHAADHTHAHDHAARAQAGVIMRPLADHHPSLDQQAAANALGAATKQAMKRYARLSDALAAGYALPRPGTGPDVHLENKVFKSDGRVLDPQRPEMLVYAIGDGRATLLGVVFVMERAGTAGPDPGGPVTRWHAHNICLTLLPPGFGIVSPFGSCPAFSVNVTTPEMMHVWIVDNPDGPFAEGLDKAWVLAYHARHGLAI